MKKAPFVNIIGVADGVCNAKRKEKKKESLSAHWRTYTHTKKKSNTKEKTHLYRAAYAYKTP